VDYAIASNPAYMTSPETRVRVIGTVGSVPRLFGSLHGFVLLGEDGRGVLVRMPAHLHTPPFNATVRVMGTLKTTDRGPELSMKTSDVWMSIATTTPPLPRTVDLLVPGTEDAWSLITASGTVQRTNTASFVLTIDDVDVTIQVPPAVGYRVKRLVKGDIVRVTGLLDLRKDAPVVIPRMAEDIVLTAHAPTSVAAPATPTSQSRGLPDWTPFAAAGGAVLMTGATKHLRELLKKRRLQLLMKEMV
jgi:hypothetical protein